MISRWCVSERALLSSLSHPLKTETEHPSTPCLLKLMQSGRWNLTPITKTTLSSLGRGLWVTPKHLCFLLEGLPPAASPPTTHPLPLHVLTQSLLSRSAPCEPQLCLSATSSFPHELAQFQTCCTMSLNPVPEEQEAVLFETIFTERTRVLPCVCTAMAAFHRSCLD